MSNFRSKLGAIRDYIIYLIYRAVGLLLGSLPLSWVFHLGQALGWLGYHILGGYRRLAWANIQIAFPDWTREEVRSCARRHFKELVANLLCSFVLLDKPWAEVRKHLDVSDFERATERINGAESVLWTINHIGNWELFIFCANFVRPGQAWCHLPCVTQSIHRRPYSACSRKYRSTAHRASTWAFAKHAHPEGRRDAGNTGGPTCRGQGRLDAVFQSFRFHDLFAGYSRYQDGCRTSSGRYFHGWSRQMAFGGQ